MKKPKDEEAVRPEGSDQSRPTHQRLIAAAAPIFDLCGLAARDEEPTPEQIEAALRGALTIGLTGVFALVSIADSAVRLATPPVASVDLDQP